MRSASSASRARGPTTASESTSVGSIVGNRSILNPDTEFQAGDLTGQGAPTLPINGNFHVNEIFC